jgi:serine/threonine-protein kinase
MVLSDDGTMLYAQGSPLGSDWELVWVDRDGAEEVIDVDLGGDLGYPALSPDGSELALNLNAEEGWEVWIANLQRGSKRKLTNFGNGFRPAWTPDGKSVTFESDRGGNRDIWIRRADGSGEAELLVAYEQELVENVWSHDGDWLIARTNAIEDNLGDILAWRVEEDSIPTPMVATGFSEMAPTLSPNSRFLAYTSNDAGSRHVYVVSFPDRAGREQISVDVGTEPVWSRDGRELFYRKGAAGDLMAVEVETEGEFRFGEERVLFDADEYRANAQHPHYDVSPDGQRFVMLRPVEAARVVTEDPVWLVLNWFTELEERLEGRR